MRESGVDPAAQAGACTVSAGVGSAGGGGDVQEEKGEEEAEEGLRVDFDEYREHFCKMVGIRPIWTVRTPDPMAAKSGRRGHARHRQKWRPGGEELDYGCGMNGK